MADDVRVSLPTEGRFAQHPCAALLGALWHVRATGAFDVTRQKLVRRFVLDRGRLLALVSNAREDRFFEHLAAKGALDGLDAPGLELLRDAAGDRPLTAAAVVAAGVLSGESLTAALREHLLAALEESAGWSDASFAIRPGKADLGGEPTADWPAIVPALRIGRAQTFSSSRPPQVPAYIQSICGSRSEDLAELTALDRRLLDACAEGMTVSRIAAHLGVAPPDARQSLWTLWRAGLLTAFRPGAEKKDERGIERVSEAELDQWLASAAVEDLPSLIGVGPGADPVAVRRAYYRTVRRFHPDRFREGPLASRHREVEQAFRLVNEALQVLTDPAVYAEREGRRRRPVGAPVVREGSEIATEFSARARAALSAGRRSDAVTLLEQAVAADPGVCEHQLRLALVLLTNPVRRREAVDMLGTLAREHPGRADVLAALALALARTGSAAESLAARRRALSYDANETTALALSGDPAALREAKNDPFLAPHF